MFYFMFGGAAKSDQGFSVPVTNVVVANLDQGGSAFDLAKAQFRAGRKPIRWATWFFPPCRRRASPA